MAQRLPKADFFSLGSSYYPPFHSPDDWARDVQRMAEAGFNALRTAELIASWEWIEPQKNHFEFGWLDRIFELCAQHGLKVLLGTGAASPPIWLLDEYPDAAILSQDGIPYPTGTMWGWACIHHPGYRAESERYLRVLLARYHEHPALLGWQIHNEPGYPAIQRVPGATELYCYCEHTAKLFREWLWKKYGDIDGLSAAWASTPTHHRYHDWSQVRPPRTAPLTWGAAGAWLDWRQFIDQSFAELISWQNQVIKESDPLHPTTTNLVHLLEGEMGVLRGIDPWLYPETCDVFGFDLYPVDKFKSEPFFTSIQLDYARAPALHAGKPFWLPEIESGPIGGWVLGPLHATTPRDIRRYDLDSIAHGAKQLLYQGYREWDPLPLHWGALVDLNGEPTGRYWEAAAVNRMILSHEELFLSAQPVRSQIGILVDQKNAIATFGMGAGEMLMKAIKGAYYAFWSQKFPVEFITPELLAEGKGSHYKLLLMPFLMLVTPLCSETVTRFVENGGTVVAFAKCGMLDHRSWYWHDRPGGLTQLFGASERGVDRSEDVSLLAQPGNAVFEGISSPLKGYWHRQDFDLKSPVEVLARYADGAPAATLNHRRDGRAILFGSHFDVAALDPDAAGHHRLFSNLAALAGVVRPFSLEAGPLVDGHLLTHGDQGLFILINHGADPETSRVLIPDLPSGSSVIDLFTETPPAVAEGEGGLSVEWHLDGYGSTAFLIQG
jgi:beta-galactosidase GanA